MKTSKIIGIIAGILIATMLFLILGYVVGGYVNQKKIDACPHEHWTDGICDNCGVICGHDYQPDGKCRVCHKECKHIWDANTGKCVTCKMECQHEYENGICKICGYHCKDHVFEEGICTICDYHCPHEHWTAGICDDCGYHCKHENHDAETQICADCGEKIPHKFVNGKCVCGAEPTIFNTTLPEEYFQPCDEAGTLESKQYEAAYYVDGIASPLYKSVNIYTPYNYNPELKYNVMVLIHGAGGDENEWTGSTINTPNGSTTMCNIFDHMIKNKICEPFIVVAPCTYADFMGDWIDTGIDQIATEIRETILPYVAGHYSTYAATGSLDDITEAREHFGIGGLSNGSLYAYNAGLQPNFDLFGNYMCLSGNNQPELVAEKLNSEQWAEYPVNFLYAGAGTTDHERGRSEDGYHLIVDSTDKLVDGENAKYIEVEGAHEWCVWSSSFFNAMQYLFQ